MALRGHPSINNASSFALGRKSRRGGHGVPPLQSNFEQDYFPNTIIAQYLIVSEIGEGGMGERYLAQNRDRKVVIKFLSEEGKQACEKKL